MRMRGFLVLFLLFSCCLGLAGSAQGQQSSNENGRTLVRKVNPTYRRSACARGLTALRQLTIIFLRGLYEFPPPILLLL